MRFRATLVLAVAIVALSACDRDSQENRNNIEANAEVPADFDEMLNNAATDGQGGVENRAENTTR